MATWQDLVDKGLGFLGTGADAYLLVRSRENEERIARERAAAERAQAEADLVTAKANRDTLTKFGQMAMYAAALMVGLTLLVQLRRMWRAR